LGEAAAADAGAGMTAEERRMGWMSGITGFRYWIGAIISRAVDAFLPAASRRPDHDERQLLRERGFVRVSLLIFCGLIVIAGLSAAAYAPDHPVPLLWAAYAVLLLTNLLLVRITGRFYEVNFANNLAGLLLMVGLATATEGLSSIYIPLFLAGIAVTGNFGGSRAVLAALGGFLLMCTAIYGWELMQPRPPDDVHARFAFLFTAGMLVLLGNLSAQHSRTRARQMLRKARDVAEMRRQEAEQALAQAEQQRAQAEQARIQAETARAEAERTLQRLREAQRQMILQEKMASLGSLVAGVAHEVNTPVGIAVTGASQLRLETGRIQELAAGGRLRRSDFDEFVETVGDLARLIENNSERAARLIQSFKEVAVDQSSDARRRFTLDSYVAEVLASLSPQIRRVRHQVGLSIEPGIDIDGFPGIFAQVLTNLVMNSLMHAYPDGRSGTLTIRARRVPGGADGPDWVEMDYCDDGTGIPRELWSRIFEPFFTTRRGSGGSGLGLHLVYNIVTAGMGGGLEVGDTPGGGARFTLRFPTIAPTAARSAEQSVAHLY